MGWGVGMGIGWSTTPNGGGVGSVLIRNCSGATAYVYLTPGGFVPTVKAYLNPELTIPFYPAVGTLWNLPELINTIGGYEILSTGEIKPGLTTCPV